MTDNHFVDVSENPDSAYKSRVEALAAPGLVYTHFKGGVYRKLGEFVWQDGDFSPKQGDVIVAYEHIFPHEHSLYARDKRDWTQIVERGDYTGHRFEPVYRFAHPETQEEHFRCECGLPEHSVNFRYIDDWEHPDEPVVYLEPFLTTYNSFWQRLSVAFKYLFKNQRGLGQYEEVLLTQKDLYRMKNFIDAAVAKVSEKR